MSNPNVSDSLEANEQYRTGLDLKSKGQIDSALTWFRRAVISDPRFVGAYIEIGHICKDKARLDSMFQRYAFDAFRNAARLDFTLQDVHDQYIMMAHQMGLLDQLHDEYEMWMKQSPDNEVLQRGYKNIVAISMAIFSPQSQAGKARASSGMKKMIFAISIFSLLLAGALIFLPPFFGKGKLKKDQLSSFLVTGVVFGIVGAAGLLFHRRLD